MKCPHLYNKNKCMITQEECMEDDYTLCIEYVWDLYTSTKQMVNLWYKNFKKVLDENNIIHNLLSQKDIFFYERWIL